MVCKSRFYVQNQSNQRKPQTKTPRRRMRGDRHTHDVTRRTRHVARGALTHGNHRKPQGRHAARAKPRQKAHCNCQPSQPARCTRKPKHGTGGLPEGRGAQGLVRRRPKAELRGVLRLHISSSASDSASSKSSNALGAPWWACDDVEGWMAELDPHTHGSLVL